MSFQGCGAKSTSLQRTLRKFVLEQQNNDQSLQNTHEILVTQNF